MDEQIHKYDHLISEWKTTIISLYDIVGTIHPSTPIPPN